MSNWFTDSLSVSRLHINTLRYIKRNWSVCPPWFNQAFVSSAKYKLFKWRITRLDQFSLYRLIEVVFPPVRDKKKKETKRKRQKIMATETINWSIEGTFEENPLFLWKYLTRRTRFALLFFFFFRRDRFRESKLEYEEKGTEEHEQTHFLRQTFRKKGGFEPVHGTQTIEHT